MRGRTLAHLTAAALALMLLAPAVLAAAPSLEKSHVDIGSSVALKGWTGKRLSLADVDGDGDLDLLAQNENGRVYVIDLKSGRALLELKPHYPYGPDLGPFNGVKAGDLDGDGRIEIVNVNRAAVVSVWTVVKGADGKLKGELQWEKHLKLHHPHPTADAGAVLADLDGDGKTLELVIQTEEKGSYALRHDGTELWSVDQYGGNAEPLVLDVDGDGDLDAVFFTDGGRVYALDGPTGKELWAFRSQNHGVWPASVVSSGIADDIDGDGKVEVIFCTRNIENGTPEYAPGAPRYREHHFVLFVIRDGKLVWKAKPSWGNPLCAAYMMTGDADRDGRKEIYGVDWNTIGHKPGNWERLGDAHVFAYDHKGNELWHRNVNAFNAKATLALADANGDGRFDVIAYDNDGILVLDAKTGRTLHRLDMNRWAVKEGPVIGDLFGDGVPRAALAVEGKSNAILVLKLSGSASRLDAPWPGWEKPVASPTILPPRPRDPAPDDAEPLTSTPRPPEGSEAAGDLAHPGTTRTMPLTPLLVAVAMLLAARSKRFSGGRG